MKTNNISFMVQTPVGTLNIEVSNGAITKAAFTNSVQSFKAKFRPKVLNHKKQTKSHKEQVERIVFALQKYFDGEPDSLNDISVRLEGSAQQIKIWQLIHKVRHGQTTTYGELAKKIGGKHFARAVGKVCGQNPICLFVPCHRVVGANSIGGYAYGTKRKMLLLGLEMSQRDRLFLKI